MILSCSTITWGELKDQKDLESSLASIKRLGYSDAGIEYPMLPASLKKNPTKGGELVRRSGLTVAAVAIDTSPFMAKLVKGFGSSVGWLCLFERDIDIAIEKTKKLAEVCGKAGVNVSLHPHVQSNLLTVEDLDRVIKACAPNPTSVCVDTAHLTALDIDIPKFIARYKSKISLVHLKDLRVKKPQEKVDYSKDFVDLGDGVADLKGTIKALRAAKYTGAVMVEVDYPQDVTVERSAKKNYDVLNALLASGAR
ncbi:MAG: sugar phosphate isomerase/epimerase [Thaumarchaeota archaeon]|nr:sugar phosphate isomerase/epimerase [Nitrososphaerota archaeon]